MAGITGADRTILRINDKMMLVDPTKNIELNPKLHIGLNPVILTIRQELYSLDRMYKGGRRKELYELYKQDFLQEEKELREVGLAYINMQP